MSDLIEKAPEVVTPAVEAVSTEAPKARPPVDLDARLEEVLVESRRLSDLDKAVAARLKTADDREKALTEKEGRFKRYDPLDGHLSRGERAAAVKALLENRIDEDLLFELAKDVGVVPADASAIPPAQQLSVEEQVKAALKAERDAADAEAKKKEAEDTTAGQMAAKEQMDTFLTSSATFLKDNMETYPFIKAWGCDTTRYTALLIEHAEKHHVLPDAKVLLDLMEAEHKAKWLKAPGAPRDLEPLEDLDAHVARVYQANKPLVPSAEPERKLTAYEEAKRELDAYDREQRERVKYQAGR